MPTKKRLLIRLCQFFCLGIGSQGLAQSLDWSLAYTGDVWRNASGGLAEGNRYLDNLDLTFSARLAPEGALGFSAGELFGYVLYNNAEQLSAELVGDFQGVSNIDNTATTRLYEFWYAFALSEQHSFKFGLMDLNAEFDVIETAALFLNSSHGIGPDFAQSGINGPSIFPATTVGARYLWQINNNSSLRVAVFDALAGEPERPHHSIFNLSSDEGALLVAELGHTLGELRIGLGSWLYTEAVARLAGNGEDRNRGIYGFIEQDRQSPGLLQPAWWVRLGLARESVNVSQSYLGAGLVFPGLRTGQEDSWGVALAHARSSQAPGTELALENLQPAPAETALEISYKLVVNQRLTLQPDFQVVLDPGFSNHSDNAIVLGLRLHWQLF